jgi:hypothetical protein
MALKRGSVCFMSNYFHQPVRPANQVHKSTANFGIVVYKLARNSKRIELRKYSLTTPAARARRRHTPHMGEDMSGGGEEPPVPPDWARIRSAFEAGATALAAVAAMAGLSRQKLLALARKEGWKARGPARSGSWERKRRPPPASATFAP